MHCTLHMYIHLCVAYTIDTRILHTYAIHTSPSSMYEMASARIAHAHKYASATMKRSNLSIYDDDDDGISARANKKRY